MLLIAYYCLKVIICSGLLFGYYLLALRNNRFHQWNRYYLLAAVVVSFLLPLLRIPVMFGGDSALSIYSYNILSGPELYFTFIQKQQQFHITLPLVLLVLYITVAFFFSVAIIKNIIRIQQLKSSYPEEKINGIRFYNTHEHGTPFSFFKNIFWNNSISLSNEKGQQMLRHEMTHVHQKHSIDKVGIEVLITFAWWNPFLYYIRKELSVIHEFIADQKASAGDAKLQYASLLLMSAMGSNQYALGNPFFHSQLKRRLTMLTTSKFPKFSYLRRLIALPLACVLIALFAVHCERTHEDANAKALEAEIKAIEAYNKAERVNISIDSMSADSSRSAAKTKEEILKLYFAAANQLPDNALYIIDGNETTKKGLDNIEFKQIKNVSVLKGNDALKAYGNKGANGVILISTQQSNEGVVFSDVEVPAKFPGGIDGWRRYLERNLKYPEAAQEKGTQGVVQVQMIVDKDGDITEMKVVKEPGNGLGEEAMRVLKKGPKWIPARQNGKPVTYQFIQTITFQLQ